MIALTAGHLTRDRYPEGFVPGGGVWYVSHAWRAIERAQPIEIRARVAAAPADVPADWPGRLDVQVTAATTTFHNTYAPEGRTMRLEARAPAVEPVLPPGWSRCDVLLLAPVAGELDPAAWLAAVDARIAAAGLQGWLKQPVDGRFVPRLDAFDLEALAGLDAAFLSDEDFGGDGAWLATLRGVVPMVFVTHGPDGCTVFHGGRAVDVPAFEATEVDPTGAGDTFAAGTAAALADGADPIEAARRGSALAARCVGARGPVR